MPRLAALLPLALTALLTAACAQPNTAPRQPTPAAPTSTTTTNAAPANLTADASLWKAIPSDGVIASIHADTRTNSNGTTTPCLRLDFNFTTGGGFVVLQRSLEVALPKNYEFAFHIKGNSKKNNLEFKLLDPATNNDPTTSSVWWVNKPAYEFPADWTPITYKQRHFTFAWGPNGGKPHTQLGTIEFAIASNQGGTGSIWFDNLTFRELPIVQPYTGTPTATATDSFDAEHGPEMAIDGDPKTAWFSKNPGTALTIDFGQVREFGGLRLKWTTPPPFVATKEARQHHFTVGLSSDGTQWTDAATDWAGSGGTDYLFLPDSEARYIRIAARTNGIVPAYLGALADAAVVPIEKTATLNAFLELIASEQPRGTLPRWASKEQSFWTALGVPEDSHEALINEEGQVEVGKGAFSIEPFVLDDGTLLTWADGAHTQSLAQGHLPVATVVRTHHGLTLTITATVAGPTNEPALAIAYFLKNTSDRTRDTSLVVAARPFQVNPPAQFLNMEGGASKIHTLEQRNDTLFVDTNRAVFPASVLTNARGPAQLFLCGELAPGTSAEKPPTAVWTRDERLNSAAWTIPMKLLPGEEDAWGVIVPMQGTTQPSWLPEIGSGRWINMAASHTAEVWQKELSHSTLSLPPSAKAIEDTFYAQQAYILINRDGPGFQPGSRSYERSWIRDGSMTSAAMLQLGHTDMVKEFVRWYASYQFPDGKVPCVVDSRGPDPVPENDSHGQLIMAIANVHRYTHDTAFVKEHFEHVKKAVAYIEKIRSERMTPEYSAVPGTAGAKTKQEPGKPAVPLRAMYGLVPESISHEGYSAKPMHSYWDDLFVYRGLKDAAYCAGIVGDAALAQQWTALAKDFGETLAKSYALTMQTHNIDYLPGCVELGDFDATSTTVALWPVQAQDILPHAAIERTFDKYWDFFTNRRDNPREKWDAYTPYELRTINAFVHLGQRDRAVAALDWFMKDQYPAGWHHWAEVVWSNPRTTKFIGDMPHTWCGSDFLNSLRSMFVYEDESKDALVLFAGVPEAWAREAGGVSFAGFRTYFGTLDAKVERVDGGIRMTFAGNLALPKGGLIAHSVKNARSSQVLVDGKEVEEKDGMITLHEMPREIVWKN